MLFDTSAEHQPLLDQIGSSEQLMHLDPTMDRRSILAGGLKLSAMTLLASLAVKPALAARNERNVFRTSIYNLHTGDKYSGAYRVGNKYLPEAFEELNYVLRDHRTGEQFPMDPRVLDIVSNVHRLSGSRYPIKIISGYRSSKTNDMLRKASANSGVASTSLHMSGRAMDVRFHDVSSSKVRDIARSVRAGGVGYYAKSDFVHMDSGKVRTW